MTDKTSMSKNGMGMMQMGMTGQGMMANGMTADGMTAKVNETGKTNNTSQAMNNMKM